MNTNLSKASNRIVHLIVGLGDGGAEGILYKLIASDKTNKHIVVSLTSFGKYGKYFTEINIPVYALGFKKFSLNIIRIFRLLKIIKKCKPKILQSWMYHADLLSFLIKITNPGIKIIWNIRNTTYRFADSISRFIISRLCSILSYLVPDIIISCGIEPMNQHISIGYDKKKMKVIYNGVDVNRFKMQTSIGKFKSLDFPALTNENRPLLGMVARYDKQKGHSVLLKSLYLLKSKGTDFCCVLVGLNIDYNNKDLVSMIDHYGLSSNIFLLGQRTDLEIIYNFLDIFVLSSINGEGFPNVLIEAMACGIPCVATDVGESRFIIEKTGWVVSPADPKILSESLENAISEIKLPSWSERKSKCNNHIIKNYSLENMHNNFLKVWAIY